ncbi:MAG TPA: hypothetical protein VK179_04035 [Bacteroidales bacterium]|nr:hypothetical protein [Bacteroidales bacterium]
MKKSSNASIRYKIYEDRNLLVDILEKEIALADLKRLFLSEISDEKINTVTKILSNVILAKPLVTLEEMQHYVTLVESEKHDSNLRWAILTDEPFQTAFSMLIKEAPSFANTVGVFTTLEACTHFLDINFEETEFSDSDYKIV